MQCVILAAGRGTRLRPLTDNTPKPLVLVGGKPILDHIVAALPDEVTELIIVHGYLGEQIQTHCGEEFYGRKVIYVKQEEQKGTGHALWLCKDYIKGKFLYMFADDLHGKTDLARVVNYDKAMLVLKTDTPERFGIVEKWPDGSLKTMVEKPDNPPSDLASTGVFVFDKHIFDYQPQLENNGEFYHTDMVCRYAKDYSITVVEEKTWIPIGYPEDITKAEQFLAEHSL